MAQKAIRLQEAAVDFIDNRLAQCDPAFADFNAQFDPANGQYITPDPSAEVTSVEVGLALQLKYFQEALATFKESHLLPKSLAKAYVGICEKATWDDVLQEVKDAETRYTAANGPSRVHHRVWRWFGRHSAGLKPLVAFIPNSMYTSIVSASLGIIFDVCPSPCPQWPSTIVLTCWTGQRDRAQPV
jgi:hypothetical protein